MNDITLFALFKNKTKFDFTCETYGTNTLFILLSGEFEYSMGGDFVRLSGGNAVYCPPGVPFTRRILRPVELCMLQFSGISSFSIDSFRIGKRISEDIRRVSQSNIILRTVSDSSALHYCNDILLEAVRIAAEDMASSALKRLLAEIDDDPFKNYTNTDIAKALNCSKTSAISQFRVGVGTTPQNYISEKRIRAACNLLSEGVFTVSEVAYMCGYNDPLYFSRRFKKYTGISPSEYKKISQF